MEQVKCSEAAARRSVEQVELLEDHRWEMVEETLRNTVDLRIMNMYLGHLGVTLADLLPNRYNDTQVARDSDGHSQQTVA